jgi:AcrR family transcriptional regulator
MSDRVNPPKRRYDSPRRREQAAATARQIIEVSQRLFESQGYAVTTMSGIAVDAGVALKTVYLTFETKSGLLRAVWDMLLRGRPDAPAAQTAWYQEVIEEPDPRRKLALNARKSKVGNSRVGRLTKVIRDAASTDPDIAALWDLIQTDYHADQRVVVQSLADKGSLRPGRSVDRAADILWALVHPDLWHLLVGERSWTANQYEDWLTETSCVQLLA